MPDHRHFTVLRPAHVDTLTLFHAAKMTTSPQPSKCVAGVQSHLRHEGSRPS